jgi:sugar phosphate isomerase/epimerase
MAIACSTSLRCGSTLEDALATISRLGFKYVDLLTIDGWCHLHTQALADDFAAAVAPVDALFERYHLKPLATNSGVSGELFRRSDVLNARRQQEINGLIRYMKHAGIGVAAIQPRGTDRTVPWEPLLRQAAQSVRDHLRLGAAAGVTFALELHVHSWVETMAQADVLLAEFPDIPLVYDPTHFVMQGLDIRQTLPLVARARHVHLRNAAKGQIQAPLDSGQVDFDWVFGALKDRGYQGHFSIEYLQTTDFPVDDDARRLRDLIAQHFPAD